MPEPEKIPYAIVHKDKLISADDRLPEDLDIVVVYVGLYPVVAMRMDGAWYSVTVKKNIKLARIEERIVFWAEIPRIVKIQENP
ncbi:MAG: hypothetical protein ACO3YZ_06130 [Candidatus Nanopelagicaceae bacterium]